MRLKLIGVAMVVLGFYLLGQALANASQPEGQTFKIAAEMVGGVLIGGAGAVVYKYAKARAKSGIFDNSLDIIAKAKEK